MRKKKGRRGTHPDGQAEQLQHTSGLIRHVNEADNCCSPLHENANYRPVFIVIRPPLFRDVQKITDIFCRTRRVAAAGLHEGAGHAAVARQPRIHGNMAAT